MLSRWEWDTLPTINHPADMQFISGSTGNIISWNITYPDVSSPTYNVLRNGSLVITSQPWISNQFINISVDALSPGSYNYTLVTYDGLGGSVSDQVDCDCNPKYHPDYEFAARHLLSCEYNG